MSGTGAATKRDKEWHEVLGGKQIIHTLFSLSLPSFPCAQACSVLPMPPSNAMTRSDVSPACLLPFLPFWSNPKS